MEKIEEIFEDVKKKTSKNNKKDVIKDVSEKTEKKPRGRYAKKKKEQEEQEQLKLLALNLAGTAVQSIAKIVSLLTGNAIWEIDEKSEAEMLGKATIEYLDLRFPNWSKASPEFMLIGAWSSYFANRIQFDLFDDDKENKK